MKIQNITVMLRKNLGNYEHLEVSVSADVEDNEDAQVAMDKLKKFVAKAIETKPEAEEATPPVPQEDAPKEKKARVKKTKEVTEDPFLGQDVPPVIETPKAKNVVVYNRDLDAHRQLLSSYLSKTHPTWKTKEGVKDLSASLVGKHFIDDEGNLVPSFKDILGNFFNA